MLEARVIRTSLASQHGKVLLIPKQEKNMAFLHSQTVERVN
jgi:hypothetical protein